MNTHTKIDIAFVILHYMNFNDTLEFVDSIYQRLDTDNYKIIIVDNASSNHSGAKLKTYYSDHKKVDVLLSKTNTGFARGNNIGFKYAKNKYNPDYIVLSNSDILLLDDSFYEKTRHAYETTHFAAMGPMILTADGSCCSNPLRTQPMSREYAKTFYKSQKLRLFCLEHHLLTAYQIIASIAKRKRKPETVKKNFLNVTENIVLHGCFLIFSKQYINTFDGLDPRTFLYMEEDILSLHLQHAHMKSLYNPTLIVYHKEQGSTDTVVDSDKDKLKFRSQNYIHSLKVLLDLYQEYE